MSRFKLLTRSVPLWLVLLLLTVVAVSGVALTLTIVENVERIGLWQGIVASPHFTVTELSTTIKGLNRIDVKVSLRNTDSSAHSANVTVQLLDANGDVVAESFQLTGDVAGNSDWSSVFTFKVKDIVKSYESVVIIVKELS